MPAVIPAAVAAGTAISGAVAAHKQANAAKAAATIQAGSADKAAELQATAAAQALAFQKQQAQVELQNQAAAQLASYGQYAARQRGLSTLGEEVGLPAREIPDAPSYLTTQANPSYNPFGTGGTTPAGSALLPPGSSPQASAGQPGTASPQSFGNLSDPASWMGLVGDKSKLTSWVQQGLGPTASPDLVSYYVGKIQGQPGANPTEQAGSANYWLQKLQNDPNITGKAASTTAGTGQALPYSLASLMLQTPTSPGVVLPAA